MPSLIDMRRRIRSVRNTQQITKAMKMISAARLRKAQERAFHARPYASILKEVLASLAARSDQSDQSHLLLARRPQERITLMALSGDRGLCGAFNTNILRTAERFLAEHRRKKVEMVLVGRKGRDYFRRRSVTIQYDIAGIFAKLDYSHAREIAAGIITSYSEEKTDAVYLIYNEFKSVMTQNVVVEQLLPLPEFRPAPEAAARGAMVDYIYEESPAEIFAHLLPRYVEVQIYRALLESGAAEHAARMTAMEAATSNAGEMIDSLTLRMNRIRQANITREIIEIVSGAAAL